MRTLNYTVPPECDGRKIYHYLRFVSGLSMSLVRSLKQIPDGILLNGEHARTVDIMREGDVVTINIPGDRNSVEPSDIPLDVVYIDDDIAVVDKPAGLAMHPTHNHQGDTLANAFASYCAKNGTDCVFRAVGRLDKCTSGLVVIALNPLAASKLQGKIKKTYYAVAGGILTGSGTIDKPIYRPDPGKTLRAAGETGEYAVTHWTALKNDGVSTLCRITIETGRTHQIRVHFSSEGHPLCGDGMYGSADTRTSRAALHCGEVEFVHPVTNEPLKFTSLLPPDMYNITKNMSG